MHPPLAFLLLLELLKSATGLLEKSSLEKGNLILESDASEVKQPFVTLEGVEIVNRENNLEICKPWGHKLLVQVNEEQHMVPGPSRRFHIPLPTPSARVQVYQLQTGLLHHPYALITLDIFESGASSEQDNIKIKRSGDVIHIASRWPDLVLHVDGVERELKPEVYPGFSNRGNEPKSWAGHISVNPSEKVVEIFHPNSAELLARRTLIKQRAHHDVEAHDKSYIPVEIRNPKFHSGDDRQEEPLVVAQPMFWQIFVTLEGLEIQHKKNILEICKPWGHTLLVQVNDEQHLVPGPSRISHIPLPTPSAPLRVYELQTGLLHHPFALINLDMFASGASSEQDNIKLTRSGDVIHIGSRWPGLVLHVDGVERELKPKASPFFFSQDMEAKWWLERIAVTPSEKVLEVFHPNSAELLARRTLIKQRARQEVEPRDKGNTLTELWSPGFHSGIDRHEKPLVGAQHMLSGSTQTSKDPELEVFDASGSASGPPNQ